MKNSVLRLKEGRTVKKYIAVFLVLVIVAGTIGMIGKRHISDCGIISAETIQDINELQCTLSATNRKAEVKYYKKMLGEDREEFREELDKIDASDNIAIVVPTGKVKLHRMDVVQEVEVQEVKKGDANLVGKRIMLEHLGAGFYFSHPKETIPCCGSVQNIMQEDTKYLCFFNNMPLNQKFNVQQYHIVGTLMFCYLNLEHTNKTRLLSEQEEEYRFGDLADVEFFCSKQEVLDALNILKERIIEKYCG